MNGILLIDKEEGISSQGIISQIKRNIPIKKIGHAGTLDPLATGLLVVMVNEATKLSNYLLTDTKEYVAEVTIGVTTDTLDREGEVIQRVDVEKLDESAIDKVLNSMVGKSKQVPPMFSAIKQNGKKLYELARNGQTVERKARDIEIYSIKRVSDIENVDKCVKFLFQTKVSKGTYVRTMCEEIGKKLGYPAFMSSLRRVGSGVFNISDAYTLSDIKDGNYKLISMLDALKKYDIVEVEDDLYKKIYNGVPIRFNAINNKDDYIVFSYNDKLLAIYKKSNYNYRAERVWK